MGGYGMSALGVQRTYPGFRLKSEFDPSATCRIFHFSSPALITEVLAFADSAVYVYRKSAPEGGRIIDFDRWPDSCA